MPYYTRRRRSSDREKDEAIVEESPSALRGKAPVALTGPEEPGGGTARGRPSGRVQGGPQKIDLGISRGDKARHILRDQALRKLYADDPEIAPGTFGGAVPTGWEQIDSRFEGYSLRQKDKVI